MSSTMEQFMTESVMGSIIYMKESSPTQHSPSITAAAIETQASELTGSSHAPPPRWVPGQNEFVDLYMGVNVSQVTFYSLVFIVASVFFVRNHCRIFVSGWWINILAICICRIVSSVLMLQDGTKLLRGDHRSFNFTMYNVAVMDDLLCLVAFYLLHLCFVERLCHLTRRWTSVILCFWLSLTHLLAEPFFIIATWKTKAQKSPKGPYIHKDNNEIGRELLTVGFTLGIFFFLIQTLFAIGAIIKCKRAKTKTKWFEVGILLMIPLVLTRVVSMHLMFFLPFPHGVFYSVSYERLLLEIIPENITVLLAFLMAYLAPKHMPYWVDDNDLALDQVLPEEELLLSPGAAGTFTPLKVDSTNVLMEWYNEHLDRPYPTEVEKLELVRRTGFTIGMINTWLEDTRTYTRRNFLPEVTDHANAVNTTDGASDTRPVVIQNMVIPPPTMVATIINQPCRMVRAPHTSVVRLSVPGTEGAEARGRSCAPSQTSLPLRRVSPLVPDGNEINSVDIEKSTQNHRATVQKMVGTHDSTQELIQA